LSKFDFPYQIVFVALATLWLLILINYENPFFIVNSINLCLGRGNIFFSSSYKKRKAEKLIIENMVMAHRRVRKVRRKIVQGTGIGFQKPDFLFLIPDN